MDESALFDTFPLGVNISAFRSAYELHQSASATLRFKADTSVNSALTLQQSTMRQTMLDMQARLLVTERNRLFDEFCKSWLEYRSKQSK